MTTTQRVNSDDMSTIKNWIKLLNISSFAELIHEWVICVDLKKKEEFYKRLSTIRHIKRKPLSHCRTDKNRECIQK